MPPTCESRSSGTVNIQSAKQKCFAARIAYKRERNVIKLQWSRGCAGCLMAIKIVRASYVKEQSRG